MTTLKKTFISNLIFSFGTQIVSIVVSLILTIGIPKFLSVEDFGFWQLFIFYSSFIGFFQIGLSDGIYLKYGGEDFKKINKRIIKSEILYSFFFQILIGLIIGVTLFFVDLPYPRLYVLLMFSIHLVIGNLITWLGFLLLATNNIKKYSKSILVEKVILIFLIILLYLFDGLNFYNLILIFLTGRVLSLLYLIGLYKDYRSSRLLGFRKTLPFIKSDISSGTVLMLSNVASTLIIGIGRFVIDDKWDIITFGKVSLALSATYFFLLLLSQISFSLFPMLRLIKEESQRLILKSGSYLIGNLFLIILLFYYPAAYFLDIWIPQYHESLDYLMILMPICLFEGKMQIINTTYFKNLKKQKELLKINIFILTLSCLLSAIGAYFLNSIYFILISMLICLTLRYLISHLFLFKYYKLKIGSQIIFELLFTAIFIASLWYLDNLTAFYTYGLLMLFYLLFSKNRILIEIKYFVKL